MEIFNWADVNKLAVKQAGKPAVYVNNGLDYDKSEDVEIWNFIITEMKAIYGDNHECYDAIMALTDGSLFFFDTEEEQQRFYSIFEQPLTDSSAVYACTYSADGECQTENT